VDWIILAEDKVQRQVLGSFGFLRKGGNSLSNHSQVVLTLHFISIKLSLHNV
jgi:hypothetical protein